MDLEVGLPGASTRLKGTWLPSTSSSLRMCLRQGWLKGAELLDLEARIAALEEMAK